MCDGGGDGPGAGGLFGGLFGKSDAKSDSGLVNTESSNTDISQAFGVEPGSSDESNAVGWGSHMQAMNALDEAGKFATLANPVIGLALRGASLMGKKGGFVEGGSVDEAGGADSTEGPGTEDNNKNKSGSAAAQPQPISQTSEPATASKIITGLLSGRARLSKTGALGISDPAKIKKKGLLGA